jgi:hypothetical protein
MGAAVTDLELYEAGVRRWWPPYREPQTRWLLELQAAVNTNNMGRGDALDPFRSQGYLDACDTLDKRR